MIRAIIRLQSCTTKPGRRAFVPKGSHTHGIAAGNIRHYAVYAPTWSGIRDVVAGYDTTCKRTMGFSGINAETVESYTLIQNTGHEKTTRSVRPLPVGYRSEVPSVQI